MASVSLRALLCVPITVASSLPDSVGDVSLLLGCRSPAAAAASGSPSASSASPMQLRAALRTYQQGHQGRGPVRSRRAACRAHQTSASGRLEKREGSVERGASACWQTDSGGRGERTLSFASQTLQFPLCSGMFASSCRRYVSSTVELPAGRLGSALVVCGREVAIGGHAAVPFLVRAFKLREGVLTSLTAYCALLPIITFRHIRSVVHDVGACLAFGQLPLLHHRSSSVPTSLSPSLPSLWFFRPARLSTRLAFTFLRPSSGRSPRSCFAGATPRPLPRLHSSRNSPSPLPRHAAASIVYRLALFLGQ